MQVRQNKNTNDRSVKGEHRLLWLSSFLMILPTIAVTRLLPTQWKHWSSGKSIFTVVKDAKEQASIIATMALTAY